MRKTPLLFALLATTAAGAASAASADGWFGKPAVSLEQAVAKVQAAGYTSIRGAEYEDGAWEIRSNRPDGSRLTVFVDAGTGDILSPAQPGQKQLGPTEVVAKLAAAGYTEVRELEREDGFWTAEVRASAGFTRDVRVHPISGAVTTEAWDD
jgi:sugar phosphate isomerase/epimerase